MFSSHTERKANDYDVIISGGEGPGAMVAAYEAVITGKKVLLVSNREEAEFLRVQRVYLIEPHRKYLLNLMQETPTDPADIKMIAELCNATVIGLKDIQQFLKRRLQEVGRGYLDSLFLSTISEINLQEGRVIISSVKSKQTTTAEYTFTSLVGADGANHPSATILENDSVPSNPRFTFTLKQLQLPHPHHMTAYFILQRKDKKKITLLPKEDFIISGTALLKDKPDYFWSLSLDKISHKNAGEQQIKCLFAGEITEKLLEAKEYHYDADSYPFEKNEHESLDEYTKRKKSADYINTLEEKIKNETIEKNVLLHIRTLIYAYFKKKLIDLNDFEMHFHMKGHKKDRLKLTIFNVTMSQADQACLEQNEHYFYLMGDAYQTSNYQEGHGLNDAISHAISFGRVMNNEISHQDYNEECEQNKMTIDRSRLSYLGEFLQASMEEMRQKYIVMPYQKSFEAKKQDSAFRFGYFAELSREPTTLELFATARNQANLLQINDALITYKKLIGVGQENRGMAPFHLSICGHVEKDLRDLSECKYVSFQDKPFIFGLLIEIHQAEAQYQNDKLNSSLREARHHKKAEEFKQLLEAVKNTFSAQRK